MSHIDSMIDDYVLNLLSPGERVRVEHHIATCPQCLGALKAERRRTSRLITTLKETSLPPAGKLEHLWPAVASAVELGTNRMITPRSAKRPLHWRQVAAGLALTVLFTVGVLGMAQRFDSWIFIIDVPATASHTASPTATQTPTFTRPSGYPDSVALVHQGTGVDVEPSATGTPQSLTELDAPEPIFKPPAPPTSSP
jgi:hypothetical protein